MNRLGTSRARATTVLGLVTLALIASPAGAAQASPPTAFNPVVEAENFSITVEPVPELMAAEPPRHEPERRPDGAFRPERLEPGVLAAGIRAPPRRCAFDPPGHPVCRPFQFHRRHCSGL